MGWKKGQAVRLAPLSEATGRVLDVYRDVQQVFGVPHISSFFQFLGTYPKFLDRFWTDVHPIIQTEAFFSCASRLRAGALTRVRENFQIPDLKTEVTRQRFSMGACEELKDCINFFCYSIPISLLLSAYLSKAFEGPAGSADVPRIAVPAPKPHRRIIMVEEDSASPVVKSIFEDIRTSTDADVVHTVYRAFARWPDFLQSYWTAVKPIAISESFQQNANAIREDALRITSELPGPTEFNANDLSSLGIHEADAAALIRISDMFVHSLSAATLNVCVARVAMEGTTGCPAVIAAAEPAPAQ